MRGMLTWLLTNTTYGTWLPGDERGSVTSVRDRRASDPVTAARLEHDRPGEPWEPSREGLRRSAQKLMKGPSIYLTLRQAETLLAQFLETAEHREWVMLAASIMANHYHLVIQASDDWRADRILADLKAYATRRLSSAYGPPASETWWTGKGSTRWLRDDRAIADGIDYVVYKQPQPLVVWSTELGRIV
jgi:REP element-mobilizing transposase RayT